MLPTLIVAASLGGIVALCLVFGRWAGHRYSRKLDAAFAPRGIVRATGNRALHTSGAEVLRPLPELANRPLGVAWSFRGEQAGYAFEGLAHVYKPMGHRVSIVHSVIVLEVPKVWPAIDAALESSVDRVAQRLGTDPARIDDAAIDRALRVRCGDRAFARGLLSPEVQQVVKSWNPLTQLSIAAGHLCVSRPGGLAAGAWLDLIDEAIRLRGSLQPAFETPSS